MEFENRIIILSTDTIHHRYYINKIIDEGYFVDTVIFEKLQTKHEHSIFEIQETNFEMTNFFENINIEIDNKVNIYKVSNINDDDVVNIINDFNPKVCLVFGTSLIKDKVLSLFNKNIFNVHRGIPQFYRGLDSDLWAINDNNWSKIGTTIHKVDKKLDTGDYVYNKVLKLKKGMKLHQIRYYTTMLACDITIKLLEDFFNENLALIKQESVGKYYSKMPTYLKDKMEVKFNTYCENIN